MTEEWISWLQGLALLLVPVLGLVISGIGIWIAWQQKRIADVQLKHEQYDRRFRVYGSAKGLLAAVQADGRVTHSAFQRFVEGIADAEFLFGQDELDYLIELRKRAAYGLFVQEQLMNDQLTDEKRHQLIDAEHKDIEWFFAQVEELRERFKKTMQL